MIVTQDKSAFGGRKDTALRCIEVKLKTLSTLVTAVKSNALAELMNRGGAGQFLSVKNKGFLVYIVRYVFSI